MNVFQANLKKEWTLNRELLLDYALLSLVVAALFSLEPQALLGCVAFLFAASLGTRIGGDEAMNDSWEFVLTRPVTRGGWLRMRFLLGLLPLAALLLAFLLFDLVGLHALFGRIAGDLLHEPAARRVDVVAYLGPAAGALLVYTFSFTFALRERRPEQVMNHRMSGLILGAVVAGLLFTAVRYLLREYVLGHQAIALTYVDQVTFLGASLVISFLVFLGARRSLERYEQDAGGRVMTAVGSGAIAALIILFVVLLVVLSWMFLSSRLAVETTPPPPVLEVK